MRKYLKDEGSIVISSFIISSVLIVLILSTVTLFINDFYIVKSNENSIKAYYLAESGANKALSEIYKEMNQVIFKYLKELKEYKIAYVQNINKEEAMKKYMPPTLEMYLQREFLLKVDTFDEVVNQPFMNYSYKHSYNIKVNYDALYESIDILSIGIYNDAKKSIYAKVNLPVMYQEGVDGYNLPKIKVILPNFEIRPQTFR
ncbi:hypothetical protein [Marinisporobacter balticus]|uniref:Flp pilus-assembly TadE/G-like protein n=1 Tax=Marinisporobacter balticus TaxID=2018667 RepID=A0A4R2L597_9FIRM|nr:hypothetical protein [Marinisporobacter balticus]TCO79179.1 hypothetical protein EV214_103232 [Marinisporobacter balticus]